RSYGYRPRVAVWELTLRCNMRCRHCGSRAGKAREDELTPGEAQQLCRDLAALGCRVVTLSGGEPTLRPDWPDLARTLVGLGVTVGMISNGKDWDEEVAVRARQVGLESVAFSLDGFEASHALLRRDPGHFGRVLGAMEVCRRVGLRVSVVTTVTRSSLPELERFRAWLGELGVRRWQVQLATPTGAMAGHRDWVIAPRDVLTLVPLIAGMRVDGRLPRVFPAHDIGYFGQPEEALRDPRAMVPFWTGCPAGCSVVGIESDGNIKGCLSLPSSMDGVDGFVEGNVRRTALSEIWHRPGAFAYNRSFTTEQLGGYCRTCEYAEVCRGGCTWTTFAERGPVRDNPFCYWRQKKEREAKSCM
ncbi:MAG: radical SAM protein, partial [Myxococcota bacterium]